jgi:hypothetical protein
MPRLPKKNIYLTIEAAKMVVETSLLLGIPGLLILNALSNYLTKKKLEKMEAEMRAKGVREETIIIAKYFMGD